jgi:drug/metabolite transporter (DMT)-like permease
VHAPTGRLIAAFAAVYIIWGSTYLGIRFAIETMPPFLMAGLRFLIAGALILGWTKLRGMERPTREQWKSAAVIGTLLLMGGNGAVVFAEQSVPSGVAALMVAVTPCWMVLIDWLRPGGPRPTAAIVIGLLLGLGGVALLLGPESLLGGGRADALGTIVLMVGCLCWSTGSIYSRHARVPRSPLVGVGMQMVCGGGVLMLASALTGEFARVEPAAFSLKSVLAFLYLVVFGAIIGYSAYIWLLRASTPARVATYAYVNPVVAVLLGWMIADEAMTLRMLIAALVILGGVALITLSRQRVQAPEPEASPPQSVSGVPRVAVEEA